MTETLTLPDARDAVALGLTEDEYALICEKQGRPPNRVELAMYSLLWSEHCAYKHSRKLLRTLPTEGPAVVMGPGENAGVLDVGSDVVCAMKVESHNHPSRGRALPRRRDGRRRDPARHLRGRCAANRRPRLAALRRAAEPARSIFARRRGLGDRPLRKLDRRADGRRRALLRGRPTRRAASSTRWRSAWRPARA